MPKKKGAKAVEKCRGRLSRSFPQLAKENKKGRGSCSGCLSGSDSFQMFGHREKREPGHCFCFFRSLGQEDGPSIGGSRLLGAPIPHTH